MGIAGYRSLHRTAADAVAGKRLRAGFGGCIRHHIAAVGDLVDTAGTAAHSSRSMIGAGEVAGSLVEESGCTLAEQESRTGHTAVADRRTRAAAVGNSLDWNLGCTRNRRPPTNPVVDIWS